MSMAKPLTKREWVEFQGIASAAVIDSVAALAMCLAPGADSGMDDPLGDLRLVLLAARATDYIGMRIFGPQSYEECVHALTWGGSEPGARAALHTLIRRYEGRLDDQDDAHRVEAQAVTRALEVLEYLDVAPDRAAS
jgi:hypothetical protein